MSRDNPIAEEIWNRYGIVSYAPSKQVQEKRFQANYVTPQWSLDEYIDYESAVQTYQIEYMDITLPKNKAKQLAEDLDTFKHMKRFFEMNPQQRYEFEKMMMWMQLSRPEKMNK
jgi:hypothetical protein